MKEERRNRWFRFRGWIGTVFLVSFGIVVAMSAPVVPEDSWLDFAIDAIAWIFFIVGAVLRFWATLYIGGRKSHTLVCHGPYSVCRNPLYVGSLSLVMSAGLFVKSATFLAGIALPMLVYMLGTIPAEEKTLREVLGSPYDDYRKTTPRLWPQWSRFYTPDTIQVHVKGLRIEGKRALRWVWIPVIAEAIAHLRMAAWWPNFFPFP